MRLVTAVEISSVDRAQQDLHLLGYLIDHYDSTLRERLSDWREDREHRADAMGDALRELGYEIDSSESSAVRRRASRSAARTSPTPSSGIPPTPSACAPRASTSVRPSWRLT